MRKRIIQKLTMLALIVMASIPAFAQGGKFGSETNAGVATEIGFHPLGTKFDYKELKLEVTEESPYMVEVIGFSDAVLGDPSLFDGTNENFVENTLVIPHVIEGSGGQPTTIFEGVRANAFAEVDEDLVSMVTYLQIDYNASYVASNSGTPLTAIGANAFAGLTSVATVTSFSPTPPTCSEDAFATSVYEDATLVVPTGSMPGYANTDGWSNFYTIVNADGYEHGDVNIDNKVNKTDITIFRKWLNDDDDVDYDKILDEEDLDFNNDGKVNKTDISALRNWINRD